ncbi:MAG: hypothetical protein KGS72_06030 [Cyanobacteria bacterium REEB67]|nr:hypothetical protein [Cyanobacteria bacterium REEB67]
MQSVKVLGGKGAGLLAASLLLTGGAFSPVLALQNLAGLSSAVVAVYDIDGRQGDIHERLRDAMESGRLTDVKLHALKDELQKVADEEAGYKAKNGELSGWQTMHLQFALDKISKELEADLTDRKGGPVDVAAESQKARQRLDDSLAAKKLTQQEYDQFKSDLDAINRRIDAARGADGQLPTNDQVRIALDLDNFSQRFTAGEHQRQADMSAIDQRKDELRQMIRNGVATGRLTEDEVDDLRQQLYNYDAKEARLVKLGRPLTSDEQLAMALELERFGAEVRARMDNGVDSKITDRTIVYRKAALDQSFANALFAGDITMAEARDFKGDLDKITADEASIRSANNNQLTQEQIEALLISVEKLKGKFSRLTYNRNRVWVGVDGMVTEIRQKIADAFAAKRLSEEENDALQSEIANVLVAKSNERNSGGFVTTNAALKLAAEITVLSEQVSKKLSDRKVSDLPDLNQRKAEIDKSIAAGVITGKLSAAQGADLLAQLKNLNFSAPTPSATDTRSKISEAIALERLSTAVLKTQHDNSAASLPVVSAAQLEQDVDGQIAHGTLTGKLTAREVQALRDQYHSVTGAIKSGSGVNTSALDNLDAARSIALVNDLNKLLAETKSVAENGITAMPDVDKREAELKQRIIDGVMQGRLSQVEADQLQQELIRIEAMETKYRSQGGFSLGEQASLTLDLEKTAHAIEAKMHDEQLAQPDVDQGRGRVDTLLAEAVDSGALTVTDCAPFAQELDNISRGEASYRFSGNGLSYTESLTLQAEIDKLIEAIHDKIASKKSGGSLSVSLDSRIKEAADKVNAAAAARKIDGEVRARLQREVERIIEEKKAFSASAGSLSLTEVSSVIRDLDRLNSNLSGRLGTGRNFAWTDIDSRPLRLEGIINRGLATGKIKPAVAAKARRELAIFKQMKAQMKVPSRDQSKDLSKDQNKDQGRIGREALSYPQQITLAQQLDKVAQILGLPSQRTGEHTPDSKASATASNGVSH